MSNPAATFATALGSLLRGGAQPRRALEELSRAATPSAPVAQRALETVRRGESATASFAAEPGEDWRLLAASWAIAERSGAPLAATLDHYAEGLVALDALKSRRAVLLAGPKSTVFLVSALPLVAFIAGEFFGVGTFEQLSAAPGLISAVTGVLLMALGLAWGLAMVRSVSSQDRVAGCETTLLWIALAGGSTLTEARRIVVHTVDDLQVAWADLDAFASRGTVTKLLDQAAHGGVSLQQMLTMHANEQRAITAQQLETAAERLGIGVLLPLGLCILPSLVCLGVIPVMLGLLGQ